MRVIGSMIYKMVMGQKHGKMVQNLQANINQAKSKIKSIKNKGMVKEYINGKMVPFMKENGKIIRFQDLAHTDGFNYLLYQ